MRAGRSIFRMCSSMLAVTLVATAMLSLAGCATPYGTRNGGAYAARSANGRPRRANCTDCGRVRSVRRVYVEKNSSTLGTVIGAVVGGVLGNQVGKGNGRTAATAAGAVAGGAAGHYIGKQHGQEVPAWQIVVRENNGRTVTVTQKEDPRVRAGDHVQVRNGHVYLL